jgi:uncharacterized protein YodC (DUF2158 family)
MTKELKAGNVVRAKCGGPLMTVSSVSNDRATLDWFDDGYNLHHGVMQVEQLVFERE